MLESAKEKERQAAEAAEKGENLALGVVSKLSIRSAAARAAVLKGHADSPKSPLSNMVSFECAMHAPS